MEADAANARVPLHDVLTPAWVGTQLRVAAVTGLAASHTDPFVRVLYHAPSRRCDSRHRRDTTAAAAANVVSLESDCRVRSRLRREPNRRFTATWSHAGGRDASAVDASSAFALPPALASVEVQVWNRFANGFDVFLGFATVAIESLFLQQQQHAATQASSSTAVALELHTPWMWLPLLHAADAQTGVRPPAPLSVQFCMSFVCDAPAAAVRRKVARSQCHDSVANSADAVDSSKRIADPTFAFTAPFEAIDWTAVVGTSLRHIFFHTDVERLSAFKHQVLYGDLARELQLDNGLHVHATHAAAFALCQLSAQYLDHCVATLAHRCNDYSEQHRALSDTRCELAAARTQLRRQRRHLTRESDELELLLTTYKSVADKQQLQCSSNDDPAADAASIVSTSGGHVVSSTTAFSAASPSTNGNNASSPSPSRQQHAVEAKPAFLMTWEERERERKLEKERTKTQRIADEKHRLEQLAADRHAREMHAKRLSSLLGRAQQRAAACIQHAIRRRVEQRQRNCAAIAHAAATTLQRCVRRRVQHRRTAALQEHRRAAREQLCMAQSEAETRAFVDADEQDLTYAMAAAALSDVGNDVDQDLHEQLAAHNRPDVSALMATWRTLRRIFTLAHAAAGDTTESSSSSRYRALFAKLDERRDGVIDRAELRSGVRTFGVRIDRRLTRVLIAFVRAKCGAEARPLHIDATQFVRGFDLPLDDKDDAGNDGNNKNEEARVTSSRYTPHNRAHAIVSNEPTTRRGLSILSHNGDKDENNIDADDGSDAADPIARIADTLNTLRNKIVAAATQHLAAHGKPVHHYRAFRDALAFVFQEFDADRNGTLDVCELVACIESIGLRVAPDSVALLRECFGCESDSDSIRIAEFISFALVHSSGNDSNDDVHLGVVGAQLRRAVLQRVYAAQQLTETVDDAVRRVFERAFPDHTHRKCSVRAFTKALSALKLGVPPMQLARLVARLDKNRDATVSMDELLVWLQLRSASDHSTPASTSAAFVRLLLLQLAGVESNSALPVATHRPALLQLFRSIDRNDSKTITRNEIERFLIEHHGAAGLEAIVASLQRTDGTAPLPLLPPNDSTSPAALAALVVETIRRGTRSAAVTLDEWLAFALDKHTGEYGDITAAEWIDRVRTALQTAVMDEARLVAWFHTLTGAIAVADAAPVVVAPNDNAMPQMKVRNGVLKTALRAKVKVGGSTRTPLFAIDAAVTQLDSDHSGWVSTRELQRWTFPLRTLDALQDAIAARWRVDEQQLLAAAPERDVALALYRRFDTDSNGVLAQRELRNGFASFGLALQADEVATLTQAFDRDRDGCWSRAEFFAFVYTLLPHAVFAAHRELPVSVAEAAVVDNGAADVANDIDSRLAVTETINSSSVGADSYEPTAAVVETEAEAMAADATSAESGGDDYDYDDDDAFETSLHASLGAPGGSDVTVAAASDHDASSSSSAHSEQIIGDYSADFE